MVKEILINTESNVIVTAGTSVEQLVRIAGIKCKNRNFIVIDATPQQFNQIFTVRELSKMYMNLTGGDVSKIGATEISVKLASAVLNDLEIDYTEIKDLPKPIEPWRNKMSVFDKEATEETKAATAKKAKKEKEAKVIDAKNGITRPKDGTVTGRVWDISSDKGEGTPRKEVIDACVGEGINAATAATQYGRWRKYHGLTGNGA